MFRNTNEKKIGGTVEDLRGISESQSDDQGFIDYFYMKRKPKKLPT